MASFPSEEVSTTVNKIAQILKRRKETVSVSEAACGGLLSAYLVSVPGASQWFHGGTLVYSLKSRLKLSGWSEEDIMNYTGPSEKVALRLARNLRIELGSTYVISETGVAGPLNQGNNKTLFDDEDVGTVFLGISTPLGEKSKVHKTGSGDRAKNMQEFARCGLQFFLEELESIDSKNHTNGEENKRKKSS
jgi:PncC family amidohydrolase